jgi:hypothetical protein
MTAMIHRLSTLLFAVALFTSAGCDAVIDVSGTVRDQAGVPLDGVAVTLTTPGRQPRTYKTTKDGAYHVGYVGGDPLDMRVSFRKDGYKTLDRPVGKEERVVMNITLPDRSQPNEK